MMLFNYALLSIFAIIIFARSPKVLASSNAIIKYDLIYNKYASQYDLDSKLIKSIAIVESSENHNAVNLNDPSVGLMQILCKGWPHSCDNKFPAIPDWPPSVPGMLLDPDYNVKIGTQILKYNIEHYGFKRGIAVYNAWNQRLKDEDGPFDNQSYVDKVLSNYKKLGGAV